MKQRVCICDVCGKTVAIDENKDWRKFKVRRRDYSEWDELYWVNDDICPDCWNDFIAWRKEQKNDSSSNR